MGKYFGTDGIRGIVNEELSTKLAFKAGSAAAMVLAQGKGSKPLVTIGKDTRISGDMLEAAMVAGLCSAGADVMLLGVIPTPAVAYITIDCGADAGVVISASHNPYEHNGIKIFSDQGFKISDEIEEKIEQLIDGEEHVLKKNCDIGSVIKRGPEFVARYIDHIVSCAQWGKRHLRVVIDCAHGAASSTVSEIFSRFPLELDIIKDHPNGSNINANCGSTHPESLCRMVVAGGFDVGIAFDGDADRCIVVDEKGNIVDGDKIMSVCGTAMMRDGRLKKNTIVATVMSNLGLHEYASRTGINLECATVGDRYVLEKMLESGYNLGGEQSGHVIFLDDATTGDGQLAAVKFLSVLSQTDKTVSELVSPVPSYPQVLLNVELGGTDELKRAIMSDEDLIAAIKQQESMLGKMGRILVRPSGTESLIRVMVEAKEDEIANNTAIYLANIIKNQAKKILS